MRLFRLFAPALFALGIAGVGQAGTFTFDQTINLDPSLVHNHETYESYSQTFTGMPSFALESGDVLTGTITFANGPVTIESAAGDYTDYLWIDFLPSDLSISDFASADVTWQGLTLAPGSSPPETSGTTNGSGALAGTSPEGLGHDFSVTGMTYAITFNSVELNGAQTSGSYSLFGLYMKGDSVAVGPGGSAPEPQFVALFVVAAILLAALKKPRCFTSLAGVVVLTGFVSPAARADTIYSTLGSGLLGGGCCVSAVGTYPVGSSYTGSEFADMFTPSTDALATSVDVYVGDNAGADGELTVEIAAADGLGNPGTVLASQTITGLAVPLTYVDGLQTLTFSSGAALTGGDSYFVIFTGPNLADYESSVYQSNVTAGAGYFGSSTGGEWDLFTGTQQAFDVQGSEIPSAPEPGTFALIGAGLIALGVVSRRWLRLVRVHVPVLLLAVSGIGRAGTFTFDQTINLDPSLLKNYGTDEIYYQAFTDMPSFTVKAGDVLTGTITFANGPVTIMSAAGSYTDYMYLSFGTSDVGVADSALFSGTEQGLTVAPGTSPPTSSAATSGNGVEGGTYAGGLLYDFSVTGLTYTFTFTSVQTCSGACSSSDPQTSESISFDSIYIAGDRVDLGQAGSAPEAQSVALFVIAAFLLGALKIKTLKLRHFTWPGGMAGLIVPASPAARSDTTYSVLATGFAALALPGIPRTRRGWLSALLILVGTLGVSTSAHAGTITWGTVQNETGNASDVITNGVFLESATAYTGADLTLNGVTFAHQTSFTSSVGSFADGSQIQVEGTGASPVSGAGTPAGWNSNYADLVSAGYFDLGSFAVSFANGFVLGGLTVGDSYEIQLFEPYLPYVYGDNQPAAFSSTYAYPATYSGGSGLLNTGYVYSTPGSTAQYVTGTFTATATTQNVYISAWGESDSEPDTAWDAIQVRDDTTPEPGTMLLVGTGLIGLACVRRHRRSTPCPGIETRSQSAK
jgi:hypothetical protein